MGLAFPLRIKLQLATVLAVLGFGALNALIVSRLQFQTLKEEQDRRIRFAGWLLASRLTEPLLYGDRLAVQKLLDETRSLDQSFAAIFLTDDNGVLRYKSGLVVAEKQEEFRQESFPILRGKLGHVVLQVSLTPLKEQVATVLRWLAAMILGILVLGMGVALAIARSITKPVESLVAFVRSFGLDDEVPPLSVRTSDELEELAQAFTAMATRVSQLHRQATSQARVMARLEHLATVGTLAAGVAHEINNPLAGIRTGLERLMRRLPPDNQTQKYSATMRDALARIERAVQGLLRFARAVEVHLEEVNVRELAEQAWELVRPCWERQSVRLEMNLPKDWPPLVADSGKVRDVFINLFLNACEAMGGEGTILVTGELEKHEARVTVSDTGPGVPEELRERIFDPFFSTKKQKGTGLGLSVSRAALREMGGDLVLLASERGACFQLTLKILQP